MRRIAFLAVLAAILAGCGGDSGLSLPPNAIARVGDRLITRAQFDAAMNQTRHVFSVLKRPFPKPGTPEYDQIKDSNVALLVDRARIEVEAKRAGIVVTAAQVEARLQEFKKSLGEARYRQRLRQTGLPESAYRAGFRTGLLLRRLRGVKPTNPKVVFAKGWKPAGAP